MKTKKIKSNVSLMIVTILSLCLTNFYPVFGSEYEMVKKDYEKIVTSFIYSFDNIEEEVKFKKFLRDIDNVEAYALLDIGNEGYAVVAKDSDLILEIRYKTSMKDIQDKEIYMSAGCFIDKNDLKKIKSDIENQDKINELRNKNQKIKLEKETKFKYKDVSKGATGTVILTKPSQLNGGTEVGVSDSRMTLYQRDAWRNNSQYSRDGVCGSIAAATMVTYHDMYVSSNYIIQPYDCSTDAHARWIINHFKGYCEILSNGGSTPYSVANGITRALYALNSKSAIVGNQTSSESTIKSKIKAGRPVVLELPSVKPNPYGAHMVCAYKYVDYNGYLWYKASDNWGNLAWINRNWVGQGIYLN